MEELTALLGQSAPPWMQRLVLGNSLLAYFAATLAFLVLWYAFYAVRRFALHRAARRAKRSPSEQNAYFLGLTQRVSAAVLPLLALAIAADRLHLPHRWHVALKAIILGAIVLQVLVLATYTVTYFSTSLRPPGVVLDAAQQNARRNIATIVTAVLWVAGVLFLLNNFGFNISALVAGLGIGGIAVALAAQAILGDAFSSFVIALDKPFQIGDFIVVDSFSGTVMHVGLKTTQVRALGGEVIVFSNSDLTKARIRNFAKMNERRVQFDLGLAYGTPAEKLREVPALVKSLIEGLESLRFDHCKFMRFGDSALLFETAYYVSSPDFNLHAARLEELNLRLIEAFSARGIQFAFPGHTVFAAQPAVPTVGAP